VSFELFPKGKPESAGSLWFSV